jgi:predicted RND superfamily exporter protein
MRHEQPGDGTANGGAPAPGGKRPFRLALGIERFGLVSLHFPFIGAVVFVLLVALAALGVTRIEADDSLSQLFRSETPEFKQYEEVTKRFPSSEYDVLIVLEGRNLMDRGTLSKVRDLVTDLQLIEGTRGIISLFSARQPPEGNHLPEPLFPEPLPEGKDYDALVQKVLTNEIIRGKLIAEDGTLALVVLALDPAASSGNGLSKVIGDIRKTVAEDVGDTGLRAQLSGVPVMQLDIRNAMERDRVIYNALGFVAGCLIAIAFFRRVSFMVIAAGPPLTAILLALGVLGWLDFKLNIFLNVMTPLIMVISFADSMQLTFLARDRLIAGATKYEAFRDAILIAGPACVLTHATAGLSFFSLLFANSELIRTFGEAGIIATVVALVAVLTLLPLLGMLLIQRDTRTDVAIVTAVTSASVLYMVLFQTGVNVNEVATKAALVAAGGLIPLLGVLLLRPETRRETKAYAAVVAAVALAGVLYLTLFQWSGTTTDLLIRLTLAVVGGLALLAVLVLPRKRTHAFGQIRGADSAVDMLRAFCGWIAHRMVARPGLYTLIAVTFIAALGVIYVNLQPRYRLADLVPDKEQAVEASGRLDAKLTGANPLDILIEFPKDASLYDDATLDTIASVHTILEKQAGVGNVWSIETLRRWLREKAGHSDIATLKTYVDILPAYLTRRFLSEQQDAVVVSGRIPDKDASQLLPVVESLDKSLNAVRTAHPGYRISVTGLSAIAARNSAAMIGKLNMGLTVEIVFVAAFVGLCFRSFVVGLAVIPPGIFPVLVSGDTLYALGDGLQFASIVALTVSFGLALSATIHFLNRLRLEEKPGEDPGGAVERATILVGPALILTSVVLACGLIATVLSDLPSLRLFGWLSAFAMISALVADMLILRPTIMSLKRLALRRRKAASAG